MGYWLHFLILWAKCFAKGLLNAAFIPIFFIFITKPRKLLKSEHHIILRIQWIAVPPQLKMQMRSCCQFARVTDDGNNLACPDIISHFFFNNTELCL